MRRCRPCQELKWARDERPRDTVSLALFESELIVRTEGERVNSFVTAHFHHPTGVELLHPHCEVFCETTL
jgi:hypothetical protein